MPESTIPTITFLPVSPLAVLNDGNFTFPGATSMSGRILRDRLMRSMALCSESAPTKSSGKIAKLRALIATQEDHYARRFGTSGCRDNSHCFEVRHQAVMTGA